MLEHQLAAAADAVPTSLDSSALVLGKALDEIKANVHVPPQLLIDAEAEIGKILGQLTAVAQAVKAASAASAEPAAARPANGADDGNVPPRRELRRTESDPTGGGNPTNGTRRLSAKTRDPARPAGFREAQAEVDRSRSPPRQDDNMDP